MNREPKFTKTNVINLYASFLIRLIIQNGIVFFKPHQLQPYHVILHPLRVQSVNPARLLNQSHLTLRFDMRPDHLLYVVVTLFLFSPHAKRLNEPGFKVSFL